MNKTEMSVKELREHLGLTQQAFATLIGVSFVSVNKWENERAEPSGLSVVLLELLEDASTKHAVNVILKAMHDVATEGVTAQVERLVELGRMVNVEVKQS